MDAIVIHQILSQNTITAPFFRGVFASDTIPDLAERSAIVVNLDESSEPGSHWVAFYKENNKRVEFFDSYGNSPEFYGDRFDNFISQFSEVNWNSTSFQSPTSNVCGAYCIYFLFKRCQGHSLYSIISYLNMCKTNDFRMYQFVKKTFGVRMIFKK